MNFKPKTKLFLPFLVFLILIALVLTIYKLDLFLRKPAGLNIVTNLPAQVILNRKSLGQTPYQNNRLRPGEYSLELKPQQTDLPSWHTKLTLTPKTTTTVHYNFTADVASSSGYLLQFEASSDHNKAFLSLITDPDICSVSIDDQAYGFSPLKPTALPPGEHQLVLTSPGFKPLKINLRLVKGFNLLVQAKLARDFLSLQPALESSASAATPSAATTTPSPSPTSNSETANITRPYVIIQPTGTGWLRVRNKPNTTDSEEIGKVDVGTKLKFIEANDQGWYKVIFQGKEAWISGRYAQLYR